MNSTTYKKLDYNMKKKAINEYGKLNISPYFKDVFLHFLKTQFTVLQSHHLWLWSFWLDTYRCFHFFFKSQLYM